MNVNWTVNDRKTCQQCSGVFLVGFGRGLGRSRQARFCNKVCQRKYLSLKYRSNKPKHLFTSTGSFGASSELRASCFLLERGYNVFRSVSQSCPFDLVAEKDGRLLKVEVTTGQKSLGNVVIHNKKQEIKSWDILIVVMAGTGEVICEPSEF